MSKPALFGRIGRFLTAARVFTANALFVLLVLAIIIVVSGTDQFSVPDGAALVIDPQGAVVEQEALGDALAELLMPTGTPMEAELRPILRAVEIAADDMRIATIVLDLDRVTALSSGHAETIGRALEAFRANGKRIVAFGSYYSQGQYLLASYADAVYLHPYGQFLPTGYSLNTLYFNELIDKLGVNIHIFRVGKYKEFVEPYTRSSMSEEARNANQVLVDALWAHYGDRVATNRRLTQAAFADYVDSFADYLEGVGGDMARLALEHKLVDELLTPDQARDRIAQRVGQNDQGELNAVNYLDYLAAVGPSQPTAADQQVGVITARGAIVNGTDGPGVIAADDFVERIRAVRRSDNIRALVVRVDSPGGSAFASELIRQELELTQLAGKPVVVSMGNVAASGGYWIAATADAIYAQPTTITGSIGIFSIVPTLEQSLANIGVRSDCVGTTALSRGLDPLSGLSDAASRVLQANVEHGYDRFLTLVARGRDMPVEAVDEVAQGRIWVGARAKELGLVDELGSLQDAAAKAAELAGMEEFSVHHVTPALSPEQRLLRQLRRRADALQPAQTGVVAGYLTQAMNMLAWLDDPKDTYALCLSCNVRW